MLRSILIVACGGALGAVLRFLSTAVVQRASGGDMPWGTFFVNVVGSFLLGFLLLSAERLTLSEGARMFAAVGVLGAFTTFSAFSMDVVWLTREGEWLRAVAYGLGSVLVGVAALVAGGAAASLLVGTRG